MLPASRSRHAWLVALSLGGLSLFVSRSAHAQEDAPEATPPEGPPRPPPGPPDEPARPSSEPPSSEPPSLEPPPPTAPATPPVVEAPAPRFGSVGEVVLDSGFSARAYSTAYDASAATFRGASFSPGIDVFLWPDISLGIDVDLAVDVAKGYVDGGTFIEQTFSTVAAGPRLGINVRLGESLSFYPRLTVGYLSSHREEHVLETRGTRPPDLVVNTYGAWVGLFAPLLFHPVPHVFLGAGPSFHHDLGGERGPAGARASISARTVVGTWWGGPDVGAHDAGSARHARNFGKEGQLVLTGEAGASLWADTYANKEAGFGVNVAPGLDYFVADHISAGFYARIGYSNAHYTRHDGLEGTSERHGLAVAPRLGVDIPLTDLLSLYPRASISVGFDNSTVDGVTSKTTFAAIGAYAPLLFHVASHAFVGVGPSLSHDLVRKRGEGGDESNLGTTVGASATVGGWL